MSTFENVTIVKEANLYFDGRVSSRTVLFADGSKKTLGLMFPGEYEFGTDQKEIMQIMSGALEVLLPDATNWQAIKGGESFEVPASARFKLKVSVISDYCCSYLD